MCWKWGASQQWLRIRSIKKRAYLILDIFCPVFHNQLWKVSINQCQPHFKRFLWCLSSAMTHWWRATPEIYPWKKYNKSNNWALFSKWKKTLTRATSSYFKHLWIRISKVKAFFRSYPEAKKNPHIHYDITICPKINDIIAQKITPLTVVQMSTLGIALSIKYLYCSLFLPVACGGLGWTGD